MAPQADLSSAVFIDNELHSSSFLVETLFQAVGAAWQKAQLSELYSAFIQLPHDSPRQGIGLAQDMTRYPCRRCGEPLDSLVAPPER